jgi:excisionase family DNA binding protein
MYLQSTIIMLGFSQKRAQYRKVVNMPSLQELERWMGTRQVADALGYSRQYVIKLAQERRIRAVKTGAGWLYDPESVADFARRTRE